MFFTPVSSGFRKYRRRRRGMSLCAVKVYLCGPSSMEKFPQARESPLKWTPLSDHFSAAISYGSAGLISLGRPQPPPPFRALESALRSPVTGTSGGQPTRLQVACRVESCRKPSGQIHSGDCIRVSHEDGSAVLMFGREPEAARVWGVAGRAA